MYSLPFVLSFPRCAEVFWFFRPYRNVSFRYPGSENFALRDVSFKIEKGQLCVSPNAFNLPRFDAQLTLER